MTGIPFSPREYCKFERGRIRKMNRYDVDHFNDRCHLDHVGRKPQLGSQCGLLLVFVNKVLLDHSHTCLVV